MNWLRQNILMLLVNAIFALFLSINVGAYVSDKDVGTSQEVLQTGMVHQDGAAAILDAQDDTRGLLPRTSIRGELLKRLSSRKLQGGLGSRALLKIAGPWSDLLHGAVTSDAIHLQQGIPPTRTSNVSKDYFVYTLERMLC
ncbi:hypothetical protein [Fibrobacter sp. UWH1]|uniref:hypothetical protein n=1 Tax=Fibrobacter sp. UWH1 TaxID=1964354 RepID=UPI000B52751E|nr:hypothetical protein [Fibrobacter sp. UWH1]